MPDVREPRAPRRATRLPLVLLVVLGAMGASCSGSTPAGGAPGTPPAAARGAGRGDGRGAGVAVRTSTVLEKPMAVKVRVVGNVEPASTVAIRSQVSGPLISVHFVEGADVTAGQLLFTIDPRPLESSLRQAEAALARDTAQAKNAAAQLVRSADLLTRGLVAQAAHDALAAQAESLQATVAADKAQVDGIRRQLEDTRITAPMAGRTGALLAHPGALVRANDTTPLVVINQLSPVSVSFAVPARLLGDLRSAGATRRLGVDAALAGNAAWSVPGTVSFVDNTVDPATDTIRLKATFPNRDQRLWPGAFVEVTLRLSTRPNALVVPNAAVQASQRGQLVYVVTSDNTVDARTVAVAWTDGDESVIDDGLRAGETVVIDGQLRLTPGARVAVAPLEAAAAAEKGSAR